jgi:hypothetical protein
MIFYHATPPGNLRSIVERGLRPRRNPMDPRGKVVWLAEAKYLGRFHHDRDGMVVLEINRDDLDPVFLEEDSQSFAYKYSRTIPASSIRVRGTERWGLEIPDPVLAAQSRSSFMSLIRRFFQRIMGNNSGS